MHDKPLNTFCMYFLHILDDFNTFRGIFNTIGMRFKPFRMRFLQEDLDVDDSETGSESGFQTAPTDPPDPGGKRDRTSHVTTLVYDSEEEDEEAYDSDNSVDLLQPTQVQLAHKNVYVI